MYRLVDMDPGLLSDHTVWIVPSSESSFLQRCSRSSCSSLIYMHDGTTSVQGGWGCVGLG